MTEARRAGLVLATVTIVIGVLGLLFARDLTFTAPEGEIVFGLGVSFNPLGALVTIALGIVAAVGVTLGDARAMLLAALGGALGALQVLFQFGRDVNWLGTRGSNLSFFVALAVGMWAVAWLQRRTVNR